MAKQPSDDAQESSIPPSPMVQMGVYNPEQLKERWEQKLEDASNPVEIERFERLLESYESVHGDE